MGICWSSKSSASVGRDTHSSLTTTANFSSSGLSQNTSTTIESSANTSLFSTTTSGSDDANANPSLRGHILPNPNLRIFSFSELKAATRNFRSDTVLGEGGFGKVYKGWLDPDRDRDRSSSSSSSSSSSNHHPRPLNLSGSVIAVKKLNSESTQGFEEWRSEVNFLGRLSHPNLVKLLGYCLEDGELLLVYEFMQKGSLENHLFGRGSAVQPLSWETRIKISIDAARGLAFLHESESLIYRDFKASNILLDGSYNAKISDFGLAKLGPSESRSHVTTRVIGTHGYAAPEYVATGHLYVKSDVYGFGVVLVELLTGLRALDPNRPGGQHKLTDWIKPHLSERRKLKHIMDSRLEGKYPSKAAFQVSNLALTCLETEPKNRPSMKQVLDILQNISTSPAAANRKPKRRTNTYATPSSSSASRAANNAPRSALHQRVHHHHHQHQNGSAASASHPSYPLPQRVP